MKQPQTFKMVFIWLAFALGAACLVIIPLDWPKWHGLAQRAVETNGFITAKEPNNHMSIRYSYRVGEQSYTGIGHGGGANPEFEQLKVGDKIKVFYDSANPEVSCPDSPDRQSASIVMAVLFAIIVAPIFGFIGLYRKGWLPLSDNRSS